LKTTGDFRSRSHLLAASEALSITCHNDIRGLLGHLEEEGFLDPMTATGFRIEADKVHLDDGALFCSKYASGGMFIHYTDCMKLQRELATVHEITATIIKRNAFIVATFQPGWLRSLIWVHPNDSHGALFHTLPNSVTNVPNTLSPILFLLLSLITTIPFLWDDLTRNVDHVNNWAGYLLAYATKNIIYYHDCERKADDDPFTAGCHLKPLVMFQKLALTQQYDSPQLLALLTGAMTQPTVNWWNFNTFYNPRDPTYPMDTLNATQHHHVYMCSRERQYLAVPSLPLLASFLTNNGTVFELHYLCTENCRQVPMVYARHGGQFTNWFSMDQASGKFRYTSDDVPRRCSRRWTFAVYINAQTPKRPTPITYEESFCHILEAKHVTPVHSMIFLSLMPERELAFWRTAAPAFPTNPTAGQRYIMAVPAKVAESVSAKNA